ncbi:MAG: glycogen/starch synthase [Rhodothermales bacterium]
MANSDKILFVSGEVNPFTPKSEIGNIVRTLPEMVQDQAGHQVRILMPRYGTISERKNRLHEVIRLSGSEITVGEATDTLKVKVASIPGIRLQVYFMDSADFFKRKGIFATKSGKAYADNPERALFFARAVLQTLSNLGWSPDVVHAFGWMSALMPVLLKNEAQSNELFANAKVVYTPEAEPIADQFSADLVASLGLPASVADQPLQDVAASFADAILLPPSLEGTGDATSLSAEPEAMLAQATACYEHVLNAMPV